jgi:hypothetical protein
MRALLVAAFFACPCLVHAAEPWDRTDKTLAAAMVTMLVIDWGQTRYIAKNPDQFEERNPLLGKHPSVGDVNRHFVLAIGGSLLIGNYLSSRHRKIFFGAITAAEVAVTIHNNSIGLKVSF